MIEGKSLADVLEESLRRYMSAVRVLGKIKDGKTLFEASPTKDQDAFEAWTELDAAGKQAQAALMVAQISRDPDECCEAGAPILTLFAECVAKSRKFTTQLRVLFFQPFVFPLSGRKPVP